MKDSVAFVLGGGQEYKEPSSEPSYSDNDDKAIAAAAVMGAVKSCSITDLRNALEAFYEACMDEGK